MLSSKGFQILFIGTAILTIMMIVLDLPKWVAVLVLILAIVEIVDIVWAGRKGGRKE